MSSNISYAQLVIGPPGSGKSTYCRGMKEFLSAFGRKVAIVNLDPANETLPYDSDVDVSELVTLKDVMENLKLGPNGSLMYCMEFLEKNIEWLHKRMKELPGHYFLLDCPGQVELYTHHQSMRNIAAHIQKWNIKMVTVHLVDSHYCSDPGKFISVLLTSLSTMVQIELPHINVLSKVDLMEQYGKLAFSLDFYTEVLDLRFLLDHVSDAAFFKKYKKLNEALIGLVEDYSLVSFVPLHIEDKESMFRVMKAVDKASGYVFGQGDDRDMSMMTSSMGAEFDFFKTASVQEKYLSTETSKGTV